MQVRCPFADWRPLGTQTEPRIGRPRVFIIHTMVGYLDSVEDMFRRGGYSGTESTFGIGGPWDGRSLDGAIWQWQRLDFAADAQYDGNAYATSVETSDGGQYLRRWSDRQAESIVRLGTWWCRETGNPARLVDHPGERGFGYHRQFAVWNRSNHACPGDTRQRQYIREIIPEIRRRVGGGAPSGGGSGGDLSLLERGDRKPAVQRWQEKLLEWNPNALPRFGADGDFGEETEEWTRRFQRHAGITVDGIVGPETRRAMAKALEEDDVELTDKFKYHGREVRVSTWIGRAAIHAERADHHSEANAARLEALTDAFKALAEERGLDADAIVARFDASLDRFEARLADARVVLELDDDEAEPVEES